MTRLSTLVWMLVIVVAAFLLYRVKYDVQRVRIDIAKTMHELEQERESLDVVTAEWAYLNRPDRLQRLAEKHFNAQSLRVSQVAEVEAIPFPRHMEAKADVDGQYLPAAMMSETEE
jgi:hypothetical protein